MSKKSMIQAFVAGCLVAFASSSWGTMRVNAEEAVDVNQKYVIESIETLGESRAAQLVWYYKEENGKKYRRLYDATNQKWLTDWILCE